MISTVTTGILASLLSLTSAGPSLRGDPGPLCWFDGYYCSNTAGVAPTALTVPESATAEEKINDCYELCNGKASDTPPCVAFTLKNIRGKDQCYLLTEACEQDNTDSCVSKQACKSGPADCPNYDEEKATCKMLTSLGGDYLNWNCYLGATQINPYAGVIPVDTICKQTCPSWKSEGASGGQSQLESTCEIVAGVAGWSDTETHDTEGIVGFPKPYPKPDSVAGENPGDAKACSCVNLELKWNNGNDAPFFYDPNDEEAADFICESDLESATDAADWTIKVPNSCTLYCDQHYVATAECVDGEWTGNPEWGFWCYDEPPTPAPTSPAPTSPAPTALA